MKILAINGSPNVIGSTARVIDILLDVCSKTGAHCERINIDDYDIGCCHECKKCSSVGECIKDDDFIQLKAKLYEADGIIVSSPYYDGKPTDSIEVLIGRLFSSGSINKYIRKKYFIGISTSASDNCRDLAAYCANLGIKGFGKKLKVSGLIDAHTAIKDEANDFTKNERLIRNIKKTGQNLINDITKKRSGIFLKLRLWVYSLLFMSNSLHN